MPRIKVSSENKISTGGPQYPKLKLKKGERARIAAGFDDAWMEFVHTLRKPVVEDGEVKKETLERNGREFEVVVRDFVSRVLCTGDPDVIEEEGIDPSGCAVCALANEDPDMAEAPERRYILQVFQYKTKNNSFDVASPFSGEMVVWNLPASKFNKLIDVVEEHGDLKNHDLNLGPCENEGWQKFDIAVASKAAWQADADSKKFAVATFKENRIEDLSSVAGQKKEKRWLDRDIADIRAAWDEARGTSGKSSAADVDDSAFDGDLNSILDDSTPEEKPKAKVQTTSSKKKEQEKAKAAPAEEPEEESSVDDLLNELDSDEGTQEIPAADEDEDGMDDDTFDSLLAELD